MHCAKRSLVTTIQAHVPVYPGGYCEALLRLSVTASKQLPNSSLLLK